MAPGLSTGVKECKEYSIYVIRLVDTISTLRKVYPSVVEARKQSVVGNLLGRHRRHENKMPTLINRRRPSWLLSVPKNLSQLG